MDRIVFDRIIREHKQGRKMTAAGEMTTANWPGAIPEISGRKCGRFSRKRSQRTHRTEGRLAINKMTFSQERFSFLRSLRSLAANSPASKDLHGERRDGMGQNHFRHNYH